MVSGQALRNVTINRIVDFAQKNVALHLQVDATKRGKPIFLVLWAVEEKTLLPTLGFYFRTEAAEQLENTLGKLSAGSPQTANEAAAAAATCHQWHR